MKLVQFTYDELQNLRKEGSNLFEDAYNLLVKAYSKIGGFHSYRSANHLAKNATIIKCVYVNTTIVACSVYYSKNGYGPKCSGIGGNGTSAGKEGVKLIIKDDVGKWKDFFWIEASGPIEHWWERVGGFPMPNIYATTILNQVLELDPDNYHYYRKITDYLGNTIKIKKKMFGFPNKTVYDTIERELNKELLAWLDKNRGEIDPSLPINEAKISFSGKKLSKYDFALLVIDNIMEMARYGFNFDLTLSKQLYQYLIDSYNLLKKAISNPNITKERKQEFQSAINDVEEGLRYVSVLELHKL